VAAKQRTQQLMDARGRPLIERRGVRRSSIAFDAYHFMRTASWLQIVGLLAAGFALANLVFAAILYVGDAKVTNAHGFLDLCWFSVQTMGTIGYGYLAPVDALANVIVTVESFFGILYTALITGIIFARFATPRARVLFSKVAIIAEHDGQRSLTFRMANERSTAIVEATVRLYLVRDETLANGEPWRRVYDLPLRRSTSPVFNMSFLVVHPIDDRSPLHKMTAVHLREQNTNVVVTFTGIDDSLAEAVHARYLWTWNDVLFDHRFVDMLRRDDDGKRYLDLGPIHDTEPLTSAADPASAG
jgi:inward rectifier potassium channel